MILSVSRRTDIPAFYSEWFFNRLKEEYVMVQNPMNSKQVSKIAINKEIVDCIIFWTKNPRPMLKRLDELKGYDYYFQFTLNPYGKNLEEDVPLKSQTIIKTFIELSEKIGKDKVIWRYDPIILSSDYRKEYHFKWFEKLAKKLSPYTTRCVISFLDLYVKTKKNMEGVSCKEITKSDMDEIAEKFSEIARKYNLELETCAENIDLEKFNIKHGKCIDADYIEKVFHKNLGVKKDETQREECGCVASIDIGAYNTCRHNCKYCYANFNKEKVKENWALHDKNSPLLLGEIKEGYHKISERKVKSLIVKKEEKLENRKIEF